MSKTRVLLADDHEATLEWVRIALSDDFDVIGTARNGRDAVAEVRRLDPDVLVIDISMPAMSGLEAVAQLGPNLRTKIVFLTLHSDSDYVSAAFAVGASAYVVKSELNTDLIPAIQSALDGRKYVSRSIRIS
jgi:DNA-binding NarL/FixJ family response regulator